MRVTRIAGVVLAAVLAVSMPPFAQTSSGAKGHAKPMKASNTATHSAKGVVKSIDANTLIVERGPGKDRKEMSFALAFTQQRGGEIKAGETVSVRYKVEGASKLMAVSVEPV